MNKLGLGVIFLLGIIFFLGCTSAPPSSNSNTNSQIPPEIQEIIDEQPTPETGPGDPLQVCGATAESEECFEEALETCARATASFWSTSDGQILDFESAGLDVQSLSQGMEKCKVRVYVNADSESEFAGTNAVCLLSKNAEGIYDAYDIGPDNCTGTYVDEIMRTAVSPPAQTEPPATVRVITLTANDDGFRDASGAAVTQISAQNGEKIKFTFISDTSNNSFGGQGIKTAGGVNLFTYNNIAPGASQTTDEITVTQNFIVQNWWPNFQVKKGEFQVVVG